ncbi:MAG: adenosylhomocysteinase [Candidatus Thermoplasmatota archaeon]|nr:adenosylhomocysteinase [Euryarchaeota archaeon]MBU4031302.1 adenosylhomocysteinase [Candidatus Thermoplasmatota archaeon]MBU4070779.1 adenosylhomocysteinase [Candidatus Thermoplasmatota archaeon]MBU4145042.1 adenosylhomocysteinase [Candidatus Thermoplasmatota archaeon]MBU4590961.1 adenosylhomocysteinase [Candidatus Thermoplasmatota archaeon]
MSDSEILTKGINRLEWARTHMDVLRQIGKNIKDNGTLDGKTIGMALHVEAKTGILALTLQEAGAKVRLASCNPLSTDDSVALALNEEYGLETYAKKGESRDEYYSNLEAVLALKPQISIDDGGDLIFLLHTKHRDQLPNIIGGNEETTTGIIRLKAMEAEGKLEYPVFAVNNAKMKHLFDNRYGTGQSTFDGVLTATNLTIAGSIFVVAGYGWCGRGIAARAQGMGANVIVTEIDPVKAVEARMDGFRVMPMAEAVKEANIIVSVTGCKDIVTKEHLEHIRDGCILANSGHFDNEICITGLDEMTVAKTRVREHVEEYKLKSGKRVYLLGEGRLVNLAVGQGHPVEIMDMSFAIQAGCAERLVTHREQLEAKVYDVPPEMDDLVARLKLKAMGVTIDSLSDVQKAYLCDWKEGT